MKKFVAVPTKWKQLRINGKNVALTFFELYTKHIKKLGQFFFYTYSLTYLKKDTSEQINELSVKTLALIF